MQDNKSRTREVIQKVRLTFWDTSSIHIFKVGNVTSNSQRQNYSASWSRFPSWFHFCAQYWEEGSILPDDSKLLWDFRLLRILLSNAFLLNIEKDTSFRVNKKASVKGYLSLWNCIFLCTTTPESRVTQKSLLTYCSIYFRKCTPSVECPDFWSD